MLVPVTSPIHFLRWRRKKSRQHKPPSFKKIILTSFQTIPRFFGLDRQFSWTILFMRSWSLWPYDYFFASLLLFSDNVSVVVMEWRYVRHSVTKVVLAVWGEKRWSHREFVVLVVSGRNVNVSRKCCPEVKQLGVGADFFITVDIANFGGWRKVVPVCGVLNSSNSYSTGNPWSKRNRRKGSIN